MKKTIITIGIVIFSFFGLFKILASNKAKNEARTEVVAEKEFKIPVREVVAEMKDVSMEYTANGTFLPNREVFISTEVPGLVTHVLVKEGDKVSAGQTLAVIKGDQQQVSLTNAQAVYNDAANQVKRFENAYETGGVTKQQLDQVKLQLETAKNNLESAQLNTKNTTIRASFAGVVNAKNIEPGSYVNPGQQLFEIVDINQLKLRVNIDEKTIGHLKTGQNVEISSSVFPNQKWSGTVSFIAAKADGSLNFPVEMVVKNNGSNDLRAGMYGTATFGKNETINTLVVPRVSFVNNISSRQIFINDNGKAKLAHVNIGRDFGDFIEILSGINEGDKVITTGQINLFENTPVEVIL